ncbi:MAG TPA: DUF5069 domain-containing protein [Chthoniobacterales bacterium]
MRVLEFAADTDASTEIANALRTTRSTVSQWWIGFSEDDVGLQPATVASTQPFRLRSGHGYWRLRLSAVIRFLPFAFPLLPCRMMKKLNHAPNLTQRPPRSPRVRLGGYVVLPRILDKGRAEIAGTAGEFKFNNPGDYHWFRFTGITPEALKAELATGKGDCEMLAWIQENAPNKRSPWEIQQWSAYFSERGPDSDVETLEMFADRMKKFNPAREDVKTWFDLLDLDDHVTFGGKA